MSAFSKIAGALLLATLAVACAKDPPVHPAKLDAPSSRVMEPPKELQGVQPGADLYDEAAQCRADYSKEIAKLKTCQGYINTIRKK